MSSIELALLTFSILMFISLLASKLSAKSGLPVLLFFLGVGMLFGSDGLGIEFSNFGVAQWIGTIALSMILFSGGLDTRYEDVKPIVKQGVTLAMMGVLLTALVTGAFIWLLTTYFFPSITFSPLEAMLLASVMSSTDSASVFGILRSRGVSLKNNLRPLLELESGSNDPMAYMLTITLIQFIMMDTSSSAANVATMLAIQLVVGAVGGYLLGKLCVRIINRFNLTNDSLYPVLLLTCCLFIFSFTFFIKGNSYLAVYIGGLVIGNSKFITKRTSLKFFDGLAWLSQIVMFLALGLLVSPHELLPVAIPSIIIGFFMIIVSRPVSVVISMLPFRSGFRSKAFVSWVGLRGAVPIVFAILPLAAGVPNANVMFNIVFFITLISLLVQGSTLTLVADWLGLSGAAKEHGKLKEFDLEFSDEIKSAMSEITISTEQLEHGNRLVDMALPDKTLAVMVKRGNNYFIPKGNTELAEGDKMLVITDDENALRETYQSMGISKYNMKRNG